MLLWPVILMILTDVPGVFLMYYDEYYESEDPGAGELVFRVLG